MGVLPVPSFGVGDAEEEGGGVTALKAAAWNGIATGKLKATPERAPDAGAVLHCILICRSSVVATSCIIEEAKC